MNKMIKRKCLFHLIHFFSVILVQKMVSDNLNSGHFGYTQAILIEASWIKEIGTFFVEIGIDEGISRYYRDV